MIEIQNLTKIYKKQTVLNDVNLRLEMGKIYGLVGVNGSGKTTLMRCIAGFAKPNKGKGCG
ncbi:MAG: ATP-binding cassette domain-containing protein [Christensenellales bacterium]